MDAQSLYREDPTPVEDIAGGTLNSGDVETMADGRLGTVAGLEAVASGDPAGFNVAGGIELASATGTTFAKGAPVYWNTSTNLAVTAAGANCRFAGRALKAKVSGELFVKTALNVGGDPATVAGYTGGYQTGGLKLAVGQATTVAASDTIVTGLATVIAVIAQFDDNPGDDPNYVSASIGDQSGAPAAGSFLLKTWKNTSGSDPTPLAATTFSKKVNWIAIGT